MAKSKSISDIERRMEGLEPDSFRYRTLDCARGFKSSWIELGQCLFAVYRDKLFKGWGYLTFEAYCSKEVGIRQATAVKLLKSYAFLEEEEPSYLKKHTAEDREPSRIPSVESVNALRLAKASEKLDEEEYDLLRHDVLEEAKEEQDVKKKIKYILKTGDKEKGGNPEARKRATAARLAGQLEAARQSLAADGAPAKIVKKIEELLELLSDYRTRT